MQLWEVIEELVAGGTTLLLTTQYLEEADHLAHDIASSTTARSSPAAPPTSSRPRRAASASRSSSTSATQIAAAASRPRSTAVGKGEGVTVEQHTRKLTVPVAGGAKLLAEVIRELDSRGIEIDDIGLRRPTLDDVFISLTGHAAEEDGERQRADGRRSRGRRQAARVPEAEEGGRQVTATHLGTDGSPSAARPAAVCASPSATRSSSPSAT